MDDADTDRWDLLETCRLDPQRPASGPYQRISSRKISRTDPDATPMKTKHGRAVLGYQDHYLVDGGTSRVILHAFVTPGDVSESQVLLDQVRRTLFRRKLRPQRLIADAGYGTARNVHAIEDLGIRAYVPVHEGGTSSPYYRHTRFTYDPEQDVFYCPQGEVLRFRHRDDKHERWLYRARASVCNACAVKSACTSSKQGRLVGRSFHAEYLERVRSYSDTPAYQKAVRKRSVWVMPRGHPALRRSEGVAWLAAVPTARLGQREHRGVANCSRSEFEALAPGDRLGTTTRASRSSCRQSHALVASLTPVRPVIVLFVLNNTSRRHLRLLDFRKTLVGF